MTLGDVPASIFGHPSPLSPLPEFTMLCQRCGKASPNDAETCRSCGFRLLSLLPGEGEESGDAREILALEEAASGRIQVLEKQVRRLSGEVELLVHALEYLERSVTADRAGIYAVVRMLRERGVIDSGEFGRRWMDRATRNLAELALKDRFVECRDTALGAYRGRSHGRFEELLDRAEDHFFLLDSDGALAALRDAAALDPENLPLAGFLGECLLEKGDAAGARPHLEAASAAPEPPPRACAAWARLLLREGYPQEAAAFLEGRLRRNPQDGDLLLLHSLARGLQGKWEACGESADRALRIQENPGGLYLSAHALLRRGKISLAESALARLLALDSSCADALLQQALLHADRGRWNRARTLIERLRTLDPDGEGPAALERFRGEKRAGRKPSPAVPLQLERALDIMGSARGEARMLLKQAEGEIR